MEPGKRELNSGALEMKPEDHYRYPNDVKAPPAYPEPQEPPPSYGNIDFGPTAPPPPFNNWIVPHQGLCGLRLLDRVEKVRVEQILDMIEAVTFHTQPNVYNIFNEHDQFLFTIHEDPAYMTSRSTARPFSIDVKDSTGQVAFNISRPHKPCSMCGFCCAFGSPCKTEATVVAGQQTLGTILQNPSFSSVSLTVYDNNNQSLMDVIGSSACCTPGGEYELESKRGKAGQIFKIGGGTGTPANKYILKFPEAADANLKALCLATNILLDIRFHFFVRPTRR